MARHGPSQNPTPTPRRCRSDLAQDPAKHDVNDFLCLNVRRLGLTREVIDEHGAVDRTEDHVGDLLGRHVADSTFRHQLTIQLPPALDVPLSMLEVGRSLAILEVGPFLDDQLDKMRVFGKKSQDRSRLPRPSDRDRRVMPAMLAVIRSFIFTMTRSAVARNSSRLLGKWR